MSDIWSIASMVSRSVAVGTLVMEVMVMVVVFKVVVVSKVTNRAD